MKIVSITKRNIISCCFGFFGFKKVYVGAKFFELNTRQRTAVVSHECAHLASFHPEARILFLIFPFYLKRLCIWQEFQADLRTWELGYGKELIEVLEMFANEGSKFHPSTADRIERLKRYEQTRLAPVKGPSHDSA